MATLYIVVETRVIPTISRDEIIRGTFECERCIGIICPLSVYIQKYTPRHDVLFTYDGVTEDDERRLLQFFSKYQVGEERNWFVWNDEIYNFFLSHSTIEEVRSYLPQLQLTKKQIMYYQNLITPIVNIMVDNKIGVSEEAYREKTNCQVASQLLDYFVRGDRYFDSQQKFLDYLQQNLREGEISFILRALEVMKVVDKEVEEFNNVSFYVGKMKYVCNAGKTMIKECFDLFLNRIPLSFKKYYLTLGPGRCSTVGYQRGEMEKVYLGLIKNQTIDIRSEILKHFEVGKRYTLPFIREKLKEIYENLGYTKFPKAVDLKEYFELKICMVLIGDTGKRINGYELLKVK